MTPRQAQRLTRHGWRLALALYPRERSAIVATLLRGYGRRGVAHIRELGARTERADRLFVCHLAVNP